MKIVGTRTAGPASAADAVNRANRLISEAFRIAPLKKPRGFVAKFKTWQDYEVWRKSHPHPRFW
jgi:hypothetical protein